MEASEQRTAVILVNTGSPDAPTPEAVGEYLLRFLSHPRICPMNPRIWAVILKKFIVPSRSVKSAAKYQAIWHDGGFDFIRHHASLAEKLTEAYAQMGAPVDVAYAMSFGRPLIADVLEDVAGRGYGRIYVLPLYPQNAFSQAGIVCDDVKVATNGKPWAGRVKVLGDYSSRDVYLKAIADSVKQAGFDAAAGDRLVFSYHSIPCADIEAGDTYAYTTQATSLAVAGLLGLCEGQWAASYQSRFDNDRKWLGPFTDEVLVRMAEAGVPGRLFFVCPNFSVDNLETYHDVLGNVREGWLQLLDGLGMSADDDRFVYVPCLNDSDAQVRVVIDALACQVGLPA